MYQYKMIQIPDNIALVSHKKVTGKNKDYFVAEYMQDIVNEQAKSGWEFMRIDSFETALKANFFTSLFGGKPRQKEYSVMTFRKKDDEVFQPISVE